MWVKNWTELVISLVVGLAGSLANVALFGFVLNVQIPYLVPYTVDIRMEDSPQLIPSPLGNNLILLLSFGLQHSGMIRGPINSLVRFFLSKENAKVLFSAVTCVFLRLAFSFWAPMTYQLWDIQHEQLRALVYALCVLSWIFVVVSLLTLDPLALLGIRGHLDKVLNREKVEENFVTHGLYGLVRHPVYSFLILGLLITPTMTAGHLLFSGGLVGYILLAVAHFEEPDLVRKIGSKYEDYMKTTPRYIPSLKSVTAFKKAN